MSQENMELAQALFDGWAREEFPGRIDLLDANIEYVNPPGAVEPGVRKGIDAFVAAWDSVLGAWTFWHMQPERFVAVADKVAVVIRYEAQARSSGITVEGRESALLTLRRGKVVRYEWFHGPDDALNALGPEERAMSEESTTPGLVELLRRYVEAANRRDFDAIEASYTADAVLRGAQIGTFEGAAAARSVLEDMMRPYEEFDTETEELRDLGSGVAFAVVVSRGRVGGGEVPFRFASVTIWREGRIERQTNYTDIDEARTAAERLAQERGRATA